MNAIKNLEAGHHRWIPLLCCYMNVVIAKPCTPPELYGNHHINLSGSDLMVFLTEAVNS